jgi:hypothetical protein
MSALWVNGGTQTNRRSFQNLEIKGHAFRTVFLEPGFRGVGIRKYLDVLAVANLLAGVDVDKTVIGLSSACACPNDGLFDPD